MELAIIIALVLLNGVFAMSEMALVSSRKFKLESARKKGSIGAKTALELSVNPTRFLSTVQIGITLIGILLGVYSGENLTSDVAGFLEKFPRLRPYSHGIATGAVVVFVTYLSIVLGELLPKRLGMTFPETIISVLARPMRILSAVTSPFVWLLTASNNLLLRMLGIKKTAKSKVSEEEIKSIIAESTEGGEIQEIEQDIVERVFELGDRKVNSLMTHRGDIVYFDSSESLIGVRGKINNEKHSAYPVCRNNNLDDIIGIVLIKDFFDETNTPFSIDKILRRPLFINEGSSAFQVLEHFKKRKLHYGIVLDEYGTTAGIVTMDDVMDALVGDMTEYDDDDYAIIPRDGISWYVDGYCSLDDFTKYFDLKVDTEILSRYNTVSGLFMHYLNGIPELGERISLGGCVMEVVDKDGQRIDKILVTKSEE